MARFQSKLSDRGCQAGPGCTFRRIPLTSGEYNDDSQQFCPDGSTLYFTSNRDGFTCIWGFGSIRKPNGALRSRFSTFTTANRIYSGISKSSDMQVNVARDKIVTNLDEFHSDIWMMQLGPGK